MTASTGRLAGRRAIVTGGASGFGFGIALRFVEEGATVLIADLDGEAAGAAAGRLCEIRSGAASAIRTDVAHGDEVAAMVETATDRMGGVDILVNNAGTTHRNRPMLKVTEAEFDRIYAVNVKSIFLTAKAAVPLMKAQGRGVILNIASTAGVRPRPGLTWYNGSKGAAIVLTKSMAVELASDGIRVCALNPVAGETPLLKEFMGSDTPEVRARFLSSIPLGRFSQPRDIANAALFLASDEAEFLTGVCLEVDGGRCV